MVKGEKIYSYVKFEHELESEYREKIALCKRKSDVLETLFETVKKLLSKINDEFKHLTRDDTKLNNEKIEFSEKWNEKIKELYKNSDLEAIINRLTEVATHRIKKLENDENVDYFNIKTK
ncbi:hypothetical protein SU69_01365 [Thermosipho melanesiensis]|uniref:Uncharacterized protein n=2 Tax=Thermosipho melanesiensis TaxID=46541 RepID=A6LJN1_THEM4|nr:hypothetical protein [Thermosipho melanesiensis]ABR30132.1 hypothetical protein Tmel_0258 [Thermosipho melanesiensis BI429]APT73329.1 hypothetical protein BW47_01405 [Thermosipho melanesiensis]OOC38719.1 hypothetical protein SU68_01365 [Thermosipho melanesiensis]OOC40523.1 hypothetical protein SU70_01365 [Thermosipho melanesiensis]OOC40788.1 hypothetical protein SU69_01365 [Thermosipho melanesiensis]